MVIKRTIHQLIEQQLYKGKVIILYGARRVGKTTLAKQILVTQKKARKKGAYLNCESLNVKTRLETTNEISLKDYFGDHDLIVLDEAQNIDKIGHILKLLVDTYPDTQIIATGSSSFDLVNQIGEPLVGRSREFRLYPFSMAELNFAHNLFALQGKLEKMLRFGTYPSVFGQSENNGRDELDDIASKYLYKDILAFEHIKNSALLLNLLRLLALQIGSEVSYHEIGQQLGINHITVKKYIDLLEKCFIVFPLNAFSRNARKEISKSKKVYFYDLGIRNALIDNFNPLAKRADVGALWENFCIVERLKLNEYTKNRARRYFWRTYAGQELDYIEESGGKLRGYEFKYNKKTKFKPPSNFVETYQTKISVVNQDNWQRFLMATR